MPLIFNGNVNIVGNPDQAPQPASQQLQTFEQVRVQSVQQVIEQPQKIVDKQSNVDSGIIKPKYLNDKSVFYKTSGYLKDLLGEGN